MGIVSAFYSIIPFDENSKKGFRVDNKNKIQAFTEKDADKIIENFKKTIGNKNANYQMAKKVEDALNDMIEDDPQEYDRLLRKFVSKITDLNFAFFFNNGYINIQNGSLVLDKDLFHNNFNQLKSEIIKRFGANKNGDLPESTALKKVQGMISNYRGQVFEQVIKAIMYESGEILSRLTEQTTQQLLTNLFIDNRGITIDLLDNKIKDKKREDALLNVKKMEANQTKDNIIIDIYDNDKSEDGHLTIKGGKQKTDVQIKMPGRQFFKASLKNYGASDKSRTISLLSKGNVASFISQWPGSTKMQRNLAVNGLSAIDLNESQFNIMKKIFIIQAAMGSSKKLDVTSDYFIINTNKEKRPIKVLSMYNIFFENNSDFIKSFSGENVSDGVKPIPQIPRSEEDFTNFVKSATISIHTQYNLNKILSNYKNNS